MWNPKTLQQAYAPITVLRSIFGLYVYDICGRELLVLTIIYDVVCVGLYMWFRETQRDAVNRYWHSYQKISCMFILWVNTISAILCFITAWWQSKRIKRIMTRCTEVDTTLESFGIEKQYKKLFHDILLAVIMWLFGAISLQAVQVAWMMEKFGVNEGVFLCILFELPVLLNSVVWINITSFIRFVNCRLGRINDYLDEVLANVNVNVLEQGQREGSHKTRKKAIVPITYEARKRFVLHLLQTMKQVHLEIVRISFEINRTFHLQILLGLVVDYSVIVGCFYNIYFEWALVDPKEPRHYKRTINMILWCIVFSTKIISLCKSCDEMMSKVQTMGQIVREFERLFTDKEIRNEIQQFSMQLILYPLTFSPCGFVNLGNKFATAMFGTIVTDLVIIVQMSTTPGAMKVLADITSI